MRNAILLRSIATEHHTGNIRRRRPVQILLGVTPDIRNQGINVEVSDFDIVPTLGDLCLKGSAVFEDFVDCGYRFIDFPGDGGDVLAGFVGVEFRSRQTAICRDCVLRQELQRSQIHEHKVPSTILVQLIHSIINTINIILQRLASDLGIGEEGIVAEIVGSNPDCVDGVASGAGEEFLVCGAVSVFGVCNEGREFVGLDRGEGGVDCGEVARGYGV